MRDPTNHLKRDEFEAPKKLAEDLRSLYRGRVGAPPEVDRAIIDMCHRRLTRRRRPVLVLRWAAAGAAAAALLVGISIMLRERRPLASRAAPALHRVATLEDVDRNGRVDILDAFALARQLEAGSGRQPNWDINGDGIVDARDVDAIAMKAVALTVERPTS